MIDFKIIELDNYYDSFNVYKLFEQNKDAIFLDKKAPPFWRCFKITHYSLLRRNLLHLLVRVP